MTNSISRYAAISVCLNCPYDTGSDEDECVGDQECKPFNDAVKVECKAERYRWRNEALLRIETELKTMDYLLVKDTSRVGEITAQQVHQLIQQGRLVGSKGGRRGKDSLWIIGVVWK